MQRVMRLIAMAGLAVALGVAPQGGLPVALADEDEGSSTKAFDTSNPAFESSEVRGYVYKVNDQANKQVVTIYFQDIGLAVNGYVVDPGLKAQIKSGAVCVGRFVTMRGVRTGPTTMDVEGFETDPSTACGTPPK